MTIAAAPEEHEVRLRDGTRAVLRPIRPDDKERLQQGLRQLSPRSRYLRFHSAVRQLSAEQLRYLTEIDYINHMAWVATNPEEPDEPGMGVARYVRLADEPDVAEAAVTVLDHYQGRGLGTMLLRMLADSALANGITVFRNYVLAENTAMLEIFDEVGGLRTDEGSGVYRVDVPLADVPSKAHDKGWARVLREAARGAIGPLHDLFSIWPGEHDSRSGDGTAHERSHVFKRHDDGAERDPSAP